LQFKALKGLSDIFAGQIYDNKALRVKLLLVFKNCLFVTCCEKANFSTGGLCLGIVLLCGIFANPLKK
jgi:hypothetical protein